jgi:hypothetical protein
MAWRTQGRQPRRAERSSLAPWLAFAAAAHVALLLVALAAKRGAVPHTAAPATTAPADAVTDPIWLELIAADSAAPRAADDDSANGPDTAEPLAALERAPGASPRAAPEGVSREPTPAEPARAEPAASSAPPSSAAPSEPAAVASATGSPDAPAGLALPGTAEGAAAAPGGSGPQLSLRDLGVDRGSNPFIGSVTEQPTERQLLNQRLRHAVRGEIAKQDQARGLGPEGPAVRAVTDIVMASATAPNTTALLRVRTDGAGGVTLVDVLEADRDADEWQRIAAELVRALAGKKLRVPAGSNGVSFQLRVVSRVQLPSGADPGLSVDVLGIPLKKGDGDRSTKLSILSPVIKEVEVPDSNGLRVPVVSFAIIGAAGDLADIGAVARRLVSAYLVTMETHFLPEKASPPAAPPAPPGPAAAP